MTSTTLGRWFKLGGLLLLLGAVGCGTTPPNGPPQYGLIQFELFTGNDDYRGDSGETLQAQIVGTNGMVLDTISQVNSNGTLAQSHTFENQVVLGPAQPVTGNPNKLPNKSQYINTLPLNTWVTSGEIAAIRLTLNQGSWPLLATADNWDMGGIFVTLISQARTVPNAKVLGYGILAPPPVGDIPEEWVWRFKVNPDASERNSGPTVKLPVGFAPGTEPAFGP